MKQLLNKYCILKINLQHTSKHFLQFYLFFIFLLFTDIRKIQLGLETYSRRFTVIYIEFLQTSLILNKF